MLTENYIKQQLLAAKAMDKHVKLISEIVQKYGGTVWIQHNTIEIDIPEEHREEAFREINSIKLGDTKC